MRFIKVSRPFFLLLITAVGGLMPAAGCHSSASIPEAFIPVDSAAVIQPDYTDLILPPNIAPMNFEIAETGDRFITVIEGHNGVKCTVSGKTVQIPEPFWRDLLVQNRGGGFSITVYLLGEQGWRRFAPIQNRIAEEPVDGYLAYRLIEPGYEHHGQIQLVQRALDSFDERPFFDNDASLGTCANCHSFQNYQTDRFLFHTRGNYGGTILSLNGKVKKIQPQLPETTMNAVYPSWHPILPLVAFSSNQTIQFFHSAMPNRIEVMDIESDLMIYDAEKNQAHRIDATADILETFPSWGSDGKMLYYCAADISSIPMSEKKKRNWEQNFSKIQYNLMRRSFDPATGIFGNPELVYDARKEGKSAVHPRLSPNGRFLVFTASKYGTFPIWHRESDLYLLDLTDGTVRPLDEINSLESESYHSWDSSGNWMVFSSRRDDGLYTRLYLTHWNSDGHFSKPFILPQKNPAMNEQRMKSYNVPEWISEPIPVSTGKLMRVIRLFSAEEPVHTGI